MTFGIASAAAILLVVYLLPTCVAVGRRKRASLAIGALNLLLGWTLLGWVGALVWSLTPEPHGAPS